LRVLLEQADSTNAPDKITGSAIRFSLGMLLVMDNPPFLFLGED
jgi:hypothetical protein